jgi:hypothetical protein
MLSVPPLWPHKTFANDVKNKPSSFSETFTVSRHQYTRLIAGLLAPPRYYILSTLLGHEASLLATAFSTSAMFVVLDTGHRPCSL